MIERTAGDYRLLLDPDRGGSVAAFRWRGQNLFRPSRPGTALDTACFPLVPFSNRIAHGRFHADGREIRLSPNFPGAHHPHPLHGFGWLARWDLVSADADRIELKHDYMPGEWPWPYRSRQLFTLTEAGLQIDLSVENWGATPMPVGLGLHPYFEREWDTVYRGLHRGESQTSADGLPLRLIAREQAYDWWDGAPVGTRSVDTVYTGRTGPLEISWPSRRLSLLIVPSAELASTVVYVPADEDFFCVEPVTHMTDAINRSDPASGLRWRAPGDNFAVSIAFRVRPIAPSA